MDDFQSGGLLFGDWASQAGWKAWEFVLEFRTTSSEEWLEFELISMLCGFGQIFVILSEHTLLGLGHSVGDNNKVHWMVAC